MGALFIPSSSSSSGNVGSSNSGGSTPSTRRRRRRRQQQRHDSPPPPPSPLTVSSKGHQEEVFGGFGRESPSSISSYDCGGAFSSSADSSPALTPLSMSTSSLSTSRSYDPRTAPPRRTTHWPASSLFWVRKAWMAHFASSLLLLVLVACTGNRYERYSASIVNKCVSAGEPNPVVPKPPVFRFPSLV
jgi:hypothetical protein